MSSETRMFLGARATRAEDLDEKKNDHFCVDQIRNKISIRYFRFLPGFRKILRFCDGSPAENEPKKLLLKKPTLLTLRTFWVAGAFGVTKARECRLRGRISDPFLIFLRLGMRLS